VSRRDGNVTARADAPNAFNEETTMTSIRLTTLAATGLLMGGACCAQTILTVSSWLPPGHHLSANIGAWCADIEQQTSARVRCDTLAKPVASPAATLNAVRSGLADVSFTVASYNAEPLPLSSLFSVPFIGGPQATAATFGVAAHRIYERNLAKFDEYKGVKLITIAAGSPVHILLTGKPVKSADDFRGLKLLVGSKNAADLTSSLGAQPIVKPASQAYEMISGGIVDGTINPIETTKSLKLGQFVKSVTLVPGGINFGLIAVYVAESKWKALSAADQAALLAAGGEKLSQRIGASFDKEDQDALALLRGNGSAITTASDELRQTMLDKSRPVRATLTAAARERGVDKADELLAQMPGEIDKVTKARP
jgi:TRAP-type transport system periplasmic protein